MKDFEKDAETNQVGIGLEEQNTLVSTEIKSDDDVNKFTRDVRVGVVKELISTAGSIIPHNKAEKELLISALDGLDRQVVNNKRLGIDSQNADSNAAIADTMAKVLNRIKSTTGTIHRLEEPVEKVASRDPGLPEATDLVDGELDQGLHNKNYEEFKKSIDG